MPSIRTVNLVWERKVRGSYAVSRYALDDAGNITLALPRPLETRTCDLTRISADGAAEIRAAFSVETLLELEASAQSDAVIGMTSDDLYLLQGGSKARFLPDKRILFVDSALCLDGRAIVAAFSDVAGSSFALALGDIHGRVLWLREADAPLSAVTLSPDGGFIAQGTETGTISLLDAARREYWLFEQGEPIRALACTPQGKFTVYGGAAGSVGLINAEGTRRWEARLSGEVIALALSFDGALCAVLTRPIPDEGTARLFLLDSAGQVSWEYESEKRLMGLSLSPSGRYMATSGRDGTHTLYDVVFGGSAQNALSSGSFAETIRKVEQGVSETDWPELIRVLRDAIGEQPAEVGACERLLDIQQQQKGTLLKEAQELADAADFAGAMAALERLRKIAPEEPDLYTALRDIRGRWEQQEIAQAQFALNADDLEGAGKILREILAFAPLSLEARRILAGLESRRAQADDAEAERLLAEGKADAALAALERAQQRTSTAERAEKIRRAQIAMEFQEGMTAYNDKRYREAIFQFKKVLAREPAHSDARRHLNFAQRFDQDANEALNDRFSRLE